MTEPLYDFRSDNVDGAAPEILEALVDANSGTVAPYGDDVIQNPEAFLYEAHAMLTVTLDAARTVTAMEWHVGALAE